MRYNHLKNAGVDISALTVGTWGIAGANSAGVTWGDVDTEESIAAIRRMIDNGVNMVDTAPIYGDGHAETVVGKALKDGYREKVFLATKFGSYISHYTGKSVRDNKYNSVEREIEETLERLQTDYIDFYIMHWPDVNTPIDETMAVCNMLKEKGKIRYIGMSNSPRELIEEAQKYARIDVIQPPFSIVNQSEKELMEWAETQGIGTMTYLDLNGKFGALGHGISDSDTGEVVSIEEGALYETQIMGIEKGSPGKPGVMSGVIYYGPASQLGTVTANTEEGIFGTAGEELRNQLAGEALPIGYRQDVHTGEAVIRSSVSGEVKDYKIEIQKVDYSTSHKNKGMVIKVVDEELLNLTGGIVQGMSGSPIIQDGKLVGAVTHVFVQDSTRGYGIFIENMLAH